MGATLLCLWTNPKSPASVEAQVKAFDGLRVVRALTFPVSVLRHVRYPIAQGRATVPYKALIRSFRLVLPDETRYMHEIRFSTASDEGTHVILEQGSKRTMIASLHTAGWDNLLPKTLSLPPTAAASQQNWQPARQITVDGWAFDHGDFIVRSGTIEAKGPGMSGPQPTAVVIEIECPAMAAMPGDAPLLLEYAKSILPTGSDLSPIVLPSTSWQEAGLTSPIAFEGSAPTWTSRHTAFCYLSMFRSQNLL